MDEVTANVDEAAEALIRQVLRDLVKNEGLTVLSISHRPAFLADSDRILVLQDGQVAQETTYTQKYGCVTFDQTLGKL